MEREILFRGKRVDNGEWIEGNLLQDYWVGDNVFVPYSIRYKINGVYSYPIQVIPETIGQFTGLTDKAGTNIFEGDILRVDSWKFSWVVQFDTKKARFNCVINNEGNQNDFIPSHFVKVIGNIHDNPELINNTKNNGRV